VLNKFAIVPEHAILATSAFRPQTHLLDSTDLAAARACIAAYREAEEGQELFVFYNCGPHSGASQPHRHLQMLPVASMRKGIDGQGGGASWELLANRFVYGAVAVPFEVFVQRLTDDMDATALRTVYLDLYRRACRAAGIEEAVEDEGETRISYSLAMTREAMVLCPRTAEGAEVLDKDGAGVGYISLNGTVLAGTALVKSQAEWDALRGDPAQLLRILGKIGVQPRPKKTTGDVEVAQQSM